jgi:hypothetical protein
MSNSRGFSVRSLLAFMAIAAMFTASLAVPSVGWVVPITSLALCVVVFAVQRSIVSPSDRPFWLSFLAGVGFIFLMHVALEYGYQAQSLPDPFENFVAEHVWRAIHSGPLYSGLPEYQRFKAFVFCLQIISMIALPGVAAYAMTFFSCERGRTT